MAEPKSLNDALMLVCAYRECAVDVIETALADPRLRQELVARTRAQAATERELASAAKVRSEQKTFFGPDMRAVDAHTAVWRAENAGLLDVAANIIESDTPEPDWADLREMARNAGLIRSADYDPRENRYGHRDEDGYLKDGLGWVLQEWRGRDRTRLRVDLVGPIDGVRRTATLVDPTPAEVLTAARLVGLIGGRS